MAESGWDRTERKVSKGPVNAIVCIAGILFVAVLVFGAMGVFFGWFGEAASVAREEFGPRAGLDKYEWFKRTAAQLSKKKADIAIYENRIKSMEEDYEGTARKDWDRTDKQQRNLWLQEVAGVKASYNALAAEYNAQSQMFHWEMFDMTEGGKLPRSFQQYVSD